MEKKTRYTYGIRSEVKEGEPVEFIISDESRDRHGTVLRSAGWNFDNYRKNPIVGYQHNVWGGGLFSEPNPDMVIGRAEVYQEGTLTIGRVFFEPKEINELAWKISEKVRFGSMRATSVGFMELGEGETKKENGIETYYFAGQELAEFSIVNIPSNANAVKRSIEEAKQNNLAMFRSFKEFDILTDEDLNKLTIKGFLEILLGKKDIDLTDDVTQKQVDEIKTEVKLRQEKEYFNLLTLKFK